MPVVLDASLAFALVANAPAKYDLSDVAERVSLEGAVVPQHWRLEIANALALSVRRRRMESRQRQVAFDGIDNLVIRVDPQAPALAFGELTLLADRHGLTVYDAAYLELAMRNGGQLASLDEALRAAAMKEGVPILPV